MSAQKLKRFLAKIFFLIRRRGRTHPKKHDSTCFLLFWWRNDEKEFYVRLFMLRFCSLSLQISSPAHVFWTLLLWMKKRKGVEMGCTEQGRLTVCSKVNKMKHAQSWMNVKPPALGRRRMREGNCARISIDRTDAGEWILLANLQFLAYIRLLFKYWQRCTTWEKRIFLCGILIINRMCCFCATKKKVERINQ